MSVEPADIRIAPAGAADLDTVRRLLRAYAASLPFSLEYQGFAAEFDDLPAPYAAPTGCLLLARLNATAAGIVGLKKLAPGIGEMKRLYVAPEARGRGIGGLLAERVLGEARVRGYQRVRLDTHRPSMAAAIALYRGLGFAEIAPYGPNPGGEIAFFEKLLAPEPGARGSRRSQESNRRDEGRERGHG